MTFKHLLFILGLVSTQAFSQAYVEVGIGAAISNNPEHCISDNKNTCSDNPLGMIAVGYQLKDFSVELEHKSSLVEKDRGLDTIFFKYKYIFN